MNHLEPIRAVFLDIDGVLNGHEKMSNHYSRMRIDCVEFLNLILNSGDDIRLVISSSWRYLIHSGSMNLQGMENLLLTHGVDCHGGRLIGITESDEVTAERMGCPSHGINEMPRDEWFGANAREVWYQWVNEHGAFIRGTQIYKFADERPEIKKFVVIDDLDLDMREQVRTDGEIGLQRADVRRAIEMLNR